MRYGIICDCSFGDCMFNTAIARAVASQHGPVAVATQPKYRDAYRNLPYISHLVETADQLRRVGCDRVVDLTPYHHYHELLKHMPPNFSLVDVHRHVWEREVSPLVEYDERPDFQPYPCELEHALRYKQALGHQRLVAVESAFFSGQSWASKEVFWELAQQHAGDKVVWLSNQDAPPYPHVDNMLRWSRRQLIALLAHCDVFYTTGSGFFCASLAHRPGPSTVCLWLDGYYRYRDKFRRLGWDESIDWVCDPSELRARVAK